MENEKYGIELEARTDKFKAKMKNLSNSIKTLGKQVEAFNTGISEEFKRQITSSTDDFKKYWKDIENGAKNFKKNFGKKITPTIQFDDEEELKRRKKEYEDIIATFKEYSSKAKAPKVKEQYDKYIEQYEADLKNVDEQLKNVNSDLGDTNEELEETNKKAKNINLGRMFDKSIAKIKRFTYYLLGARSIFSLFMKYQSIYYQYNEQMQYQSELSQNAIALSLAPAFELLGNVMTYASIAFAKFIELLTGVNVLSKVSTKGIRDYNKSLKETQTLVSGIDEITNLTNPQNLGLASQYQALADFQKKVAEVEKFFQDNKWIQDLANGLKKVWEWFGKIYDYIKDHWDIFKYIIGGAVIASLLGGNNILFKISVLGLGTFISLIEAINDYNEAKAEYDKNHQDTHDMILKNFKEYPKSLDDTKKRLKDVKKGSKEWDDNIKDIKSHLASNLQEIINGELAYEEYKPVLDEIIRKMEDIDKEQLKPEIDFLMKLDGKPEDLELIRAYYATGSTNAKVSYDSGGTSSSGSGGTFGTTSDIARTLISSVSSGADVLLNLLKNRKYASGLDYVPYDNFPAILHKGESVVPAKYNPTIHSIGSEETNRLLETLIIKVDDLASRPNVFEIDGEKFARTTYPLLENEKRNYTYNEGVSR